MIVLNLSCAGDHLFEGWFQSSRDFDAQHAAGQVSCTVCRSTSVVRRPTAPYVQRGEQGVAQQPVVKLPAPAMQAAMLKLVREMMAGAENVGSAFPEEARKIHYGEGKERSIRGVASPQEASDLLEEGILVVPVPLPDDDSMH